jgi:hypothetical protein
MPNTNKKVFKEFVKNPSIKLPKKWQKKRVWQRYWEVFKKYIKFGRDYTSLSLGGFV